MNASQVSPTPGVESFWRVVAGLRIAAVIYAVITAIDERQRYSHPAGVIVILTVMAIWTTVTISSRVRRNTLLLLADLTIAVGTILATRAVEPLSRVHEGSPTIPLVWVTGAVLAWALVYGWPGGGAAGLIVGVADIIERGAVTQQALNGAVLLVLAGVLVGFTSTLSRRAELDVAAAARLAAAAQERTRLAAAVHDGVLQVLALVQRGSHDRALAAAAGEQEAALRSLLASPSLTFRVAGTVDLVTLLEGVSAGLAELVTPLQPVLLVESSASEVTAAVAAALANVARHAGPQARAWVLIDDQGDAVRVTVRDDGVGFDPDRLAAARREGRLGVVASVRGRLEGIGGTAAIRSSPGAGTVVELCVPR